MLTSHELCGTKHEPMNTTDGATEIGTNYENETLIEQGNN